MIEQVAADLYRIELPLPASPLKSINAYLLRGRGRFLLIDTGMNRRACRQAMGQALDDLDVDLTVTDFFITHIHADHMGLLSALADPAATIYFNTVEPHFVFDDASWHRACDEALDYGFDTAELQSIRQAHPNRRYGFKGDTPGTFRYVTDRETIRCCGFDLTCLLTPGHSPGHMCLYDRHRKVLFSGDHILPGITSYIGIMGILRMENPLQHYMDNLERMRFLPVDRVLPGHRRPFEGLKQRIDELMDHHRARLAEITAVLSGQSPLSAWEIASRMHWDYRADWSDFPVQQKWFAMSETLSHLVFLQQTKAVRQTRSDSVWTYAPCQTG